MCGGQRVNGK
ncbi:hypothetical protein YPPY94_4350, partial [Yersinia pestis PY-94]